MLTPEFVHNRIMIEVIKIRADEAECASWGGPDLRGRDAAQINLDYADRLEMLAKEFLNS